MAVLRLVAEIDFATNTPKCRSVWVWCPGCNDAHRFWIALADGTHNPSALIWEWDGNETAPTFSPSLLITGGDRRVCHSFIRAGQWEFLGDSKHHLAGQTVPMVQLPDWLTSGE